MTDDDALLVRHAVRCMAHRGAIVAEPALASVRVDCVAFANPLTGEVDMPLGRLLAGWRDGSLVVRVDGAPRFAYRLTGSLLSGSHQLGTLDPWRRQTFVGELPSGRFGEAFGELWRRFGPAPEKPRSALRLSDVVDHLPRRLPGAELSSPRTRQRTSRVGRRAPRPPAAPASGRRRRTRRPSSWHGAGRRGAMRPPMRRVGPDPGATKPSPPTPASQSTPDRPPTIRSWSRMAASRARARMEVPRSRPLPDRTRPGRHHNDSRRAPATTRVVVSAPRSSASRPRASPRPRRTAPHRPEPSRRTPS